MQKNTLAAVIFALALFLLFVLVLPEYDAIRMAREAIDARQALLKEVTALLDKVSELDRQASLRQSDIEKIKTFLPERKQIDEVVSSIQAASGQSGLQLSVLTTSEVLLSGEAEYKKIVVGVDLIGVFPSFIEFLKLIEQSLRLYDIYEIAAAISTTSPGNVNFAVKMNAYYLK